MLNESMPTTRAPCSARYRAALPVRNGWPVEYASLRQCRSQPVCTRTALCATSCPRSGAIDRPRCITGEVDGEGLDVSEPVEVEFGKVRTIGVAVEWAVYVRARFLA